MSVRPWPLLWAMAQSSARAQSYARESRIINLRIICIMFWAYGCHPKQAPVFVTPGIRFRTRQKSALIMRSTTIPHDINNDNNAKGKLLVHLSPEPHLVLHMPHYFVWIMMSEICWKLYMKPEGNRWANTDAAMVWCTSAPRAVVAWQ